MGRGESNPGGFLRFLISLSHFLFTNFPAVPAAPARLSGLPVIRQSICLVLLSSKGQPFCLHPKAEAPIRWSVSPLPPHRPALPLLCGNRYRHTHVLANQKVGQAVDNFLLTFTFHFIVQHSYMNIADNPAVPMFLEIFAELILVHRSVQINRMDVIKILCCRD